MTTEEAKQAMRFACVGNADATKALGVLFAALAAATARAERLERENARLAEFARDCLMNYDCDDEQHATNCRKCKAHATLAYLTPPDATPPTATEQPAKGEGE